MINPLHELNIRFYNRREYVKERILYGLRYSGLSFKWGCAILLEKFLGVLQRKMNMLLVKMHNSSTVTANRIWEDRKQLGQGDQAQTSDRLLKVIEPSHDKAEELVAEEEVEEGLIVGEVAYDVEQPSDSISTC